MIMRKALSFFFFAALGFVPVAAQRTVSNFNFGWKFNGKKVLLKGIANLRAGRNAGNVKLTVSSDKLGTKVLKLKTQK